MTYSNAHIGNGQTKLIAGNILNEFEVTTQVINLQNVSIPLNLTAKYDKPRLRFGDLGQNRMREDKNSCEAANEEL